MVIATRHSAPKTLLAAALLTLAAGRVSAQGVDLGGSPGLADNKPLISVLTVADSAENEIEDATRSGRNLNVTSAAPLNSVFGDVYEKCVVNMSFPCFQRKMLVYMNRMDRIKGVNVLGNIVSVVRTSDDKTPEITEEDLEKKLSPAEEETQLEQLMEHQLDKFMDSHVIRLKLPEGITAGLQGRSYAGNALDISLARMFTIVEGRGKGGGGGGGGGKKSKKMMGMMMMGMMGKAAMLIPIMMMMLKLKAMKALIIAKLALALSLIQVFKMLMSGGKGKGGGGGGSSKEVIIVHDSHGDGGSSGGWSSGGGGGGWSSGGSSGGHGGGGGGGWSSGGGGGHGGGDSYSSGAHHGGGDATYGGGDSGGGGGWSSGGGGGGWGKRSWDPSTNTHITHTTWPLYKASAYAAAAANNEEAL